MKNVVKLRSKLTSKNNAVAKAGTIVEATPLVEVRPEPEKIKTEPVAISTFIDNTENSKVDDDTFVETMEFGEPPKKQEQADNETENSSLKFSVFSPDFSILDYKKNLSNKESPKEKSIEQNKTENIDVSEFGISSSKENDAAELEKEFKETPRFDDGTEPAKEKAQTNEDEFVEKESASEDFFSEMLPEFSELDENKKIETSEDKENKSAFAKNEAKEVDSCEFEPPTVTEDVDASEFGVSSSKENDAAELEKEFKETPKFDNGKESKAADDDSSKNEDSSSEDFFSEMLPGFSELDDGVKPQEENTSEIQSKEEQSNSEVKEIEKETLQENKKSGLLNLASISKNKSKNKKKKGLLKIAEDFEAEENKTVPEVESLKLSDSSPFTFIKFGKQDLPTTELQAEKDAIVQNDGVFEISNNLETNEVKQNPVFKKLVESVLK